MIAGSDSLSNVPAEATAFLGAVAAFVVLLLVFFLYLNKKWCFYGVSALNCCDEPFTTSRSKDLDRAYCYEEQETSSDSEEDVLRRLQRSASQQSQQSSSAGHATAAVRNGVQFFQSHQQQPHQHVEAGPSSSFSRNQFSPLLQTDVISGRPSKGADLMSLAEKGKMGVARTTSIGGVSSSASSSCSTTSAEDETAAAAASGSVIRHREITAAAGPLSPPAVVDVSGGGSSARRSFMAATAAGGSYQQQQLPLQQSSIEDENDEEATPLVPPPSHRGSTSNDCIVVMGQEPMFDVADLGTGPESAARCGAIEVAFAYDAPMRKMTVHVLQARHIPTKDRGGSTHTQVRLLLLPSKKQKHKSKIRHGENPQFMESFLFHRVNPEDVNSMGVRIRLYGCERMRRERMIGETAIGFSSVNLELETNIWLCLEPRANITLNTSSCDLLSLARSDSTGSTASMQHGGVPELLIGLAYNGTTGRLAVEIVKGSHFRNLAMTRAPDTYVKLSLVSSSGQEMARSKTSVRRGQPNPLFKETFMFQVALFQLPEVTLMISVYNRRPMKRKEMIGWFSLGLNGSGEEEFSHWEDMRQVKGEQLCRWHVLVDS